MFHDIQDSGRISKKTLLTQRKETCGIRPILKVLTSPLFAYSFELNKLGQGDLPDGTWMHGALPICSSKDLGICFLLWLLVPMI